MPRIADLLVFLLTIVSVLPVRAVTPQEVLAETTAKIFKASGIECHYKATGDSGSSSGLYRVSGNKFYMEATGLGNEWYDGRTLWNLNPATKEVTVSTPTAQEVAEANPLSYLNGYASKYKIFFSRKRKDKARYLVLLNPKSAKSGFMAIEVAINKKTMLPERMIIRDKQDQVTTIQFTGLTLNKKFADSAFTFPASQYPGYETIDLR